METPRALLTVTSNKRREKGINKITKKPSSKKRNFEHLKLSRGATSPPNYYAVRGATGSRVELLQSCIWTQTTFLFFWKKRDYSILFYCCCLGCFFSNLLRARFKSPRREWRFFFYCSPVSLWRCRFYCVAPDWGCPDARNLVLQEHNEMRRRIVFHLEEGRSGDVCSWRNPFGEWSS